MEPSRRARPAGKSPNPLAKLGVVAALAAIVAIILMVYGPSLVQQAQTERQASSSSQPAMSAQTPVLEGAAPPGGASGISTEPSAPEPPSLTPPTSAVPSELSEPKPPVVEGEPILSATESVASAQPAAESNESATSTAPSDRLPVLKKYEFDGQKGEVLLGDVQDGTYGFDEPALYWILRQCEQFPNSSFVPDPPDKETTYEQLWSMPNSYRGRPVTISGVVGGVAKWEVPVPEVAKIDHFWKVELYKPVPGSAVAPVCTLLVLDDPGDLKRGTPIRAKGYFYKVRSYERPLNDDVWKYKCPVVVGRYLIVAEQTPLKAQANDGAPGYMVAGVGAAVVVFLFVLFIFIRRQMAHRAELPDVRAAPEYTPDEMAKRIHFLEDVEKGTATVNNQSPQGDDQ